LISNGAPAPEDFFMRLIFVGMLASVLSILAIKYVNNDLGGGVPLTTPTAAVSL
jgi:hypothetical protein